jgi:hypothetical protein
LGLYDGSEGDTEHLTKFIRSSLSPPPPFSPPFSPPPPPPPPPPPKGGGEDQKGEDQKGEDPFWGGGDALGTVKECVQNTRWIQIQKHGALNLKMAKSFMPLLCQLTEEKGLLEAEEETYREILNLLHGLVLAFPFCLTKMVDYSQFVAKCVFGVLRRTLIFVGENEKWAVLSGCLNFAKAVDIYNGQNGGWMFAKALAALLFRFLKIPPDHHIREILLTKVQGFVLRQRSNENIDENGTEFITKFILGSLAAQEPIIPTIDNQMQ